MKQITLKQLDIQNFKGCKSRIVNFGNVTNIYGANAAGKTTLQDAFTWLLFNKDSTGATKFNVRPLDGDGKTVDNVEICVKATIEVDGEAVELTKTQKQVWTKKRGAAVSELTGNKNTYEIDGFPASEKEFNEKVSSIISDVLFKLITDPRAFPALPWTEQREMLMGFVPDITDADIAAANPTKYAPIVDDLTKAPADKCREKAKKALAALKDQQRAIPVRIDEAEKLKADAVDLAEMELQKKALEETLGEIRAQKADLGKAYKAVADIQDEIMRARLDRSDVETAANEAARNAKNAARDEMNRALAYSKTAADTIARQEAELALLESGIAADEAEQEKDVQRWKEAKAMTIDPSATICDKCGQTLPEDKIAEIKAGFEARKQAAIDRVNAEGRRRRQEIAEARKKAEELKADIEAKKAELAVELEKAETAKATMESMPDRADMAANEKYIELTARIEELEANLATMDSGDKVREGLEERESEVNHELMELNRKFAAVEANERTQERIDELKAELRKVSQDAADQERKLYLLDEFIRDKMDALSDGINKQFGRVKFKLFETQINGGIKPTCEITMGGVPYAGLNSAGKLQAGLDVIAALSRLYQVSAPVWLDNRESVVDVPTMEAQVINLYVSGADKALRIETE